MMKKHLLGTSLHRSTHTQVICMKVQIKNKNDAAQHENQTCPILSKIKAARLTNEAMKKRIKK